MSDLFAGMHISHLILGIPLTLISIDKEGCLFTRLEINTVHRIEATMFLYGKKLMKLLNK